MAAEVDGLVVAVALPVSLSDLDLGELASVELLELGEAIVFPLCQLEVRGADVDDTVCGGHSGETPAVELWKRRFHVDGNGLRETCKGVKVAHDAKRLQSFFIALQTVVLVLLLR